MSKEDWFAIELDGKSHGALLKEQTGGRPVAGGRKVIFFVNDYGAGKGFYIWNPETGQEDDALEGWKPLNAKTPEKYLGEKIARQTSAEADKAQQKNRTIYETRLLEYLEAHPGEMVTLVSIPEEINNFRNAGGMMVNGTLIKIRNTSGELPEILVKYTEWVEKPGKQDMVPVDHELVFSPAVLSEKGPLGNVHFWINREFSWMLYPPSR